MTIQQSSDKGVLPPISVSRYNEFLDKHPLEKQQIQSYYKTEKVTDVAATGIHMPFRLEMEQHLLGMPRLASMDPSKTDNEPNPLNASNILLEILEGRDETIDFEETITIDKSYDNVYRNPNAGDDLLHLRVD
jgi:hypothetical protein